MTIARRIFLLVLLLVGAALVVGAVALMQVGRMGELIHYESENILPSIQTVGGVARDFLDLRTRMLTHIASTDSKTMEELDKAITASRQAIDQKLRDYEKFISNDADRALLEEDKVAIRDYYGLIDKSLALSREGRKDEALAMGASARQISARVVKAVDAHIDFNARMAEDYAEEASAGARRSFWLMAVVIFVAASAGMALGIYTYRTVVGALNSMKEVVVGVSSSLDFTRRVAVSGNDEVADTTRAFNGLLDTVQQSLGQMVRHAGDVSAAAGRLATSANQVSTSSGEQSEASSSMAAAVEEMTVSINHVADRAGEANQLATHSGAVAQTGAQVIGKTLSDIKRIERAVSEAADIVASLDAESAKVNAVVAVIKEVADQTNLLALNAAIEAARAGEQGRGFAVVADEVRKLAERTAASTQEISATMASMQNGARNAVKGMNTAVEQVVGSVGHAEEAERSVREIENGAERTVAMVNEISEAIREQSAASSSIAQQVERIAQMTEENSAAAGSTADTAHELNSLAEAMRSEVARYRV
ncbi:methyl-accepting chemotaxis protein [Azoarcus indigens]|uniref:Methyl-accepting chemotaxis protein n=1 Tax=Azoarcus indigens TaxID=29545 RepID=A0A4R6DUS7_9RHOO|nr:methyl-accepting chemotaxis protein [Azoarcus indigens]NMG65071.1 methyl-accepting chemotaxis protein [Azoarcus indigens]TDN48965.1 methyl-accepting chemotaxis protein [Azoarcus indigens]